MTKHLGALLLPLALIFTSGCEIVCVVPPANGRVLDSRTGQPIHHALVTRTGDEATSHTKTRRDGTFSFFGKHRVEIALGDRILPPNSYEFNAVGYEKFTTNCYYPGFATSLSTPEDRLGDVGLCRNDGGSHSALQASRYEILCSKIRAIAHCAMTLIQTKPTQGIQSGIRGGQGAVGYGVFPCPSTIERSGTGVVEFLKEAECAHLGAYFICFILV